MKNLLLATVFLFSTAISAHAQETNRNQISSVPANSRFEMVQSELAAKGTYMIDKYNGNVYQMVQGDKGLRWQKLFSEEHSNDISYEGKVNYQLFTSGLAMSSKGRRGRTKLID